MRTITHGDVTAAARAVHGLPQNLQRRAILSLLVKADAADRFRKRFGRAHPIWGNGSLRAVALGVDSGRDEPFLSDTDYLEAMAAVLDAVLDWRRVGAIAR
jgi:hypothetical protein